MGTVTMLKPTGVPVGLKYTAEMTVGTHHLVPNVAPLDWPGFNEVPPAFATAMMVGFMEETCIQALHNHLEDTESSVGIAVDVSHTAPTAVGMKVWCDCELVDVVDGKFLTFTVEARDKNGSIGGGIHKRAIINEKKFNEKLVKVAGE